MFNGLFQLDLVEYIIYTLIVTHITIVSVTIYLHRYSAHRSLELNSYVSHFFRFWLWLTTGMSTKAWTAIHRKHHAKCETIEDPHSPQILGLKKVLSEGAELYKQEALNEETLKRYGSGTPEDWIERKIYKHTILGVSILLIINFILFGFTGITIWAIQMIWIPFWAAGVINGVAHYWGYKNFIVKDASRNIFPLGILIGGEELHNNHHAFGTSAKLSNKWYEFDIGWMYIRVLEILHLAKVKKIAVRPRFSKVPLPVTENTLDNLIANRFDLLKRYSKALKVELSVFMANNEHALEDKNKFTQVKLWLSEDTVQVPPQLTKIIDSIKLGDKNMATLIEMKIKLINLWEQKSLNREQLTSLLKDWCASAESSGINALCDISYKLRSYKVI